MASLAKLSNTVRKGNVTKFYSEKNSVSDAILAKKKDDAKIRKLFQWEDETTLTGSHMKLIKLENLKLYEGPEVGRVPVCGQPAFWQF